MKSRLPLAAATIFGLIFASGPAGAIEKLTLRVTPNVSAAPRTVIVRAMVARDAGNRWLHIEADSGSFYRSSGIQLEGDKAPTVTELRLNGLPGGEYTVVAVLRNNLGQEITARSKVIVLPRLGEP